MAVSLLTCSLLPAAYVQLSLIDVKIREVWPRALRYSCRDAAWSNNRRLLLQRQTKALNIALQRSLAGCVHPRHYSRQSQWKDWAHGGSTTTQNDRSTLPRRNDLVNYRLDVLPAASSAR